MTSSFRLKKRMEDPQSWSFNTESSISSTGWEDHYVLASCRECHPDYIATTIGRPDGVKICVRKKGTDGFRVNNGLIPSGCTETPITKRKGYYRNKYATNLYDPNQPVPNQLYNPEPYLDRRFPDEAFNTQNDYIRQDVKFDGIGNKKGYIRGFNKNIDDSLKQVNPYAERTKQLENNIPPPVYDVTRLFQPISYFQGNLGKVKGPIYNF